MDVFLNLPLNRTQLVAIGFARLDGLVGCFGFAPRMVTDDRSLQRVSF